MIDLKEIAKKIHDNAVSKGWWEKDRNMGEMLMLVVSEVSEAMEADRENKYCKKELDGIPDLQEDSPLFVFESFFKTEIKNTFEDELADVVIRILDICHSRGIDLEWHIEQKMRYNSLRPYKHGGKKY